MRHALGAIGVLAAGVLLAVSAAMNWRFGYQLGVSEFDSILYGSASTAADFLKALVPFLIFAEYPFLKFNFPRSSRHFIR